MASPTTDQVLQSDSYSIRKISSFRFNHLLRDWEVYEPSTTSTSPSSSSFSSSSSSSSSFDEIGSKPTNSPSRLRIVTYNVLYNKNPWFIEKFLHSNIRFRYQQEKLLPDLSADIIGLQEVVPEYLLSLMSQPWIQKDYYLSDIIQKSSIPRTQNGTLDGIPTQLMGCLLLSKQPFTELFAIQACTQGRRLCRREFIAGCISPSLSTPETPSKSLLFISVHTTSLLEKHNVRAIQLAALADATHRLIDHISSSSASPVEAYAFGDFNLHNERIEDPLLYENGWLDLWNLDSTDQENSDERFTYDYKHNWTIPRQVPMEFIWQRRMRLDRIVKLRRKDEEQEEKEEGNWKWKKQGRMLRIGTEALPVEFGGGEWQTLHPSDHFGLQVELELQQAAIAANVDSRNLPDVNLN